MVLQLNEAPHDRFTDNISTSFVAESCVWSLAMYSFLHSGQDVWENLSHSDFSPLARQFMASDPSATTTADINVRKSLKRDRSLRLKSARPPVDLAAIFAAEAEHKQEFADLHARINKELRSREYGEKLRDLVIVLHRRVWEEIELSAPDLPTSSPSSFFYWEYHGRPAYANALTNVLSRLDMSAADYESLVRFYDNRGDMDMYCDDFPQDPAELIALGEGEHKRSDGRV